RRRGSGGDGPDPRGAGHLRQLPARDGEPGRLDSPPPARGGGGDDRRGRGDAASGRSQEAAAASAHRPRARAVSRGLEPAGGAREGRGLTYLSPLGQRYASPAMQALWGERRRIGLWRRLWLALMEAQRELGLDIPDRALAELRAHLDDADPERAAEHETLRFRGVKGTTGTQASFLELFEGAHEKVRELDLRVGRKMGFAQLFPVTGQTYTRKLDAQVLAALSGIAASCAKFATDVRLLQHEGEMLEPFESEQVGSSAMAYKRNPMRAERITSLARFVIELEGDACHTAAARWGLPGAQARRSA